MFMILLLETGTTNQKDIRWWTPNRNNRRKTERIFFTVWGSMLLLLKSNFIISTFLIV